MQLKRLFMQNILSVGSVAVEIIFPTTPGLTLIEGLNLDVTNKSSNGAGKSTIIEGILLGLHGRTLRRDHGKPLPIEALIHDENEDLTGCVEIEYDNVKIVRTFNPTKVECWQDGVPKHVASAPKSKEIIADIVGVNFETMCNILLFGQHNMFSFLEAGEPEKREVIENLMNLKEYNLFEEKARELRKRSKQKIDTLITANKNTEEHLVSQKALLNKQEDALYGYRATIEKKINDFNLNLKSLPNTATIESQWRLYNDAQIQISEINKKIQVANDEIQNLKDQIHLVTEQTSAQLSKVKRANEVLSLFGSKVNELDAKKNQVQSLINQRKIKYQETETKITAAHFFASEGTCMRIRAAGNVDVMKTELAAIAEEGKKIKQKIDSIVSNKITTESTCPTCYGKVDPNNAEEVINHYNNDLNQLRERYANKKAEIDAKTAEVETQIEREIKILNDKYESDKKEQKLLAQEIEDAEKALSTQYGSAMAKIKAEKEATLSEIKEAESKIMKEMDALEKPLSQTILTKRDEVNILVQKREKAFSVIKPHISLDGLAQIAAKKESITQQIAETEIELTKNPYEEIVNSLKQSVQEIADKSAKEVDEIRHAENTLPYYDFWATAMGNSGIKSFLIDKIIPTLNTQIDYWLQLIYQGAISVSFDKFLNVAIHNNASKRGLKRYGQGSGGERRRIDIAIMLAFRQIMKMSSGKDPNIVFFDEVAENIDEEGLQWLYNVLAEMAKTSRVYVITHNTGLLGLLANADKLTVVKEDGATTVKQ